MIRPVGCRHSVVLPRPVRVLHLLGQARHPHGRRLHPRVRVLLARHGHPGLERDSVEGLPRHPGLCRHRGWTRAPRKRVRRPGVRHRRSKDQARVGSVAANAAMVAARRRSRASESAGRRALRRFVRHRAALAGMLVLGFITLAAVLGPIIYGRDPDVTDLAKGYHAPDAFFLLGADSLGRDLLARLLVAGRVSLSVGLAAAVCATGVGLFVGLLAGTFGGWVDSILMRLADIVYALPLLLAVAVVSG